MAEPFVKRGVVTPDDYSPIVGVVAWILLASTVLSVCVRLSMKFFVIHELNMDDLIIVCAMASSIGQSIAVAIQNQNGIGRHQSSLSQSEILVFEKAGYSSDLLFIVNIALSKIAILILLRQITPVPLQRRFALSLIAFIACWGISALFASAFQCPLAYAWDLFSTQCFNQISFWTYFGVINILTEIAIIALPIYTLWNVHISAKSRAAIIACFAIRITIVGAVIAQLILLNRLSTTNDFTFESWPYYLSMQVAQNLSVITACIPYIKNFMLGLESGMIRVDDQERRRKMSTSKNTDSSNSGLHSSRHRAFAGSARRAGTLAQADVELAAIDRIRLTNLVPEGTSNTTTIEPLGGNAIRSEWNLPSESGTIQAITEISVDVGP
ncbi:hypothetical protein MMC30_007042 [Trapelia coarctata]|nr:hypothetical protein [Trapelia coarctata]